MVAVRVKPLVDASLSAMLIGACVSNPLIEELSIQSARYKTDENAQELLMQKAICLPHLSFESHKARLSPTALASLHLT